MEDLKYIIDDSTIVELFGFQNFSTAESAVLELVKNAYDAKALSLRLEFKQDTLAISDDGTGMNEDDIKNYWMHIGKSNKGYQIFDGNNNTRIQAGSKGVGRFALSRLGKEIKLVSKRKGFDTVIWKTNWASATLETKALNVQNGTTITVNFLRERWTDKRIQKLCNYLELTYNDTAMAIIVAYDSVEKKIPLHFYPAKPGKNCKSVISLCFDNGLLTTVVQSDEFVDKASDLCDGIDIHNFKSVKDINEELKTSDIGKLLGEDLSNKVNGLGKFNATFYFNIVSTQKEMERFLYKHRYTPEAIDGGIVLYRNAFSISSYEGKKDWLGLGKRSRKSPASASHPTGAWRVRENQIVGFVCIDKQDNEHLQDLANRQGLDENEYYQVFVEIINSGIAEFERYRQNIIRKIVTQNIDREEKETPLLDKIVKKPNFVKKLSAVETKKLVSEIKEAKKEQKESKKHQEETEARYKYDVRILNVLATTGLKASAIAHEMKNDMNTLNSWYTLTIDALKEYGMWEELNTPENTRRKFRNVPKLLLDNQNATRKVALFMNTMLEDIEKRQFEVKQREIRILVDKIIETWKRDYAWVDISLDVDDTIEYHISEDVLQVILDNLILNTVQQNSKKEHINIEIKIILNGNYLEVDYSDDGVGLDRKYKDDPMRILQVHETTRPDGHGLGMWIINNTCVMSGGEIIEIKGNSGFYIRFILGGSM